MHVKPERIKYSWWFLGFKWILALAVIHGFVWKWDQWLLNPQKQKSLLHITGWSCRSCVFTVGVCEVFGCASTEHGICPVLYPLPCQKSHKELKDTQGLTLMVQLLTIGCCVKSEWLLHGLAPWGGLGAGWALEPGCWGADRCCHQSQGATWCFLICALETQSSSIWLLEKGGFIFHGKSSVWRSSIRHWAVEKTKLVSSCLSTAHWMSCWELVHEEPKAIWA